MKLNTDRILKIIEVTTSYGRLYNTIHYTWDSKTESARPCSPVRTKLWISFVFAILLHQIFMAVGILSSFLLAERRSITYYALQVVYFIGFLIITVSQVCIFLHRREWISFINGSLAYFKKIEGTI